MVTVLAALAALSFSVGGYFTKLSRGLTVLGPSAMMFALFALGSALQALAMRNESMAFTYAFVLGLEAVTAFVLSVWLLGESASLTRISGIGFVVVGIALLKSGAPQ
jgi:multidrug transporter EmrE-like cation transporter